MRLESVPGIFCWPLQTHSSPSSTFLCARRHRQFSRGGPLMSGISNTWEHVRTLKSIPHPPPLNPKSVFQQAPQVILIQVQTQNPWTSSAGPLALWTQVGFISWEAHAAGEREGASEHRLLLFPTSHLHSDISIHKRCRPCWVGLNKICFMCSGEDPDSLLLMCSDKTGPLSF